jgi:hypothetical protein
MGWVPAAERGQTTCPLLPGTKMLETLCISLTNRLSGKLQFKNETKLKVR